MRQTLGSSVKRVDAGRVARLQKRSSTPTSTRLNFLDSSSLALAVVRWSLTPQSIKTLACTMSEFAKDTAPHETIVDRRDRHPLTQDKNQTYKNIKIIPLEMQDLTIDTASPKTPRRV
ncbi:hypothetical protein BDI4_1080086 [Burkholderia diffusa]|uniref:hypothetical protein n=1 Tax=Burkholderia diffusa TaxID=488732 RepID=UPI001CB00666|nr:hypothetical protein [Burkholderia diffusa]CAG9241905.1 hypothetical protein BDI4_1080086 [Burkholderia diffusa]